MKVIAAGAPPSQTMSAPVVNIVNAEPSSTSGDRSSLAKPWTRVNPTACLLALGEICAVLPLVGSA